MGFIELRIIKRLITGKQRALTAGSAKILSGISEGKDIRDHLSTYTGSIRNALDAFCVGMGGYPVRLIGPALRKAQDMGQKEQVDALLNHLRKMGKNYLYFAIQIETAMKKAA